MTTTEQDLCDVSDAELRRMIADGARHCLELQSQNWTIQQAWKLHGKPTPFAERVELLAAIADARASQGHLKAEWRRRTEDSRERELAYLERWHFSDMLLAELMQVCEKSSCSHLVKIARENLRQRLTKSKN